MNARIVFVPGTKLPVACSNLIDRARRFLHERAVAFRMIEMDKRKRFVRKYHRGPTVDDFMDQHFSVSLAVVKVFDIVRRAECEVVIRQPGTWPVVSLL